MSNFSNYIDELFKFFSKDLSNTSTIWVPGKLDILLKAYKKLSQIKFI